MGLEMKCEEVWGEISNYADGALDAALRQRMDHHLTGCARCRALLDGIRNISSLVGDPRTQKLPADLSKRLYAKLNRHIHSQRKIQSDANREIPVGITDDKVRLGSHLIYFWESDREFERGVRFLDPGLGRDEHCIVFGHDEAIEKVLSVLEGRGFDTGRLIRDLKLTVIHRRSSAQGTLSDISDVAQAALKSGATAIRFLGNLGMGRDPLPAGEDDVLELETKATTLISPLPCVIVCMYDVKTVSGRLILKGGLETHHLAVCPEGICENPYFSPDPNEIPGIGHIH